MGQQRDMDTGTIDYKTDAGTSIQAGFRISSEGKYKDAAKALASWNITDDNSGTRVPAFSPRRLRLKIQDKTLIDLSKGEPGGDDNFRTVDIIIPDTSKLKAILGKVRPGTDSFNGKKIIATEYFGETIKGAAFKGKSVTS